MRFIPTITLTLSLLLSAVNAGSPPNILLILTDDHGWSQMSMEMDPRQEGACSDYLETPNMVRLMKEGMGKIGEDLVFFTGGHTSTGIGGFKAGRPVVPNNDDIEAISMLCPSIDKINPQIGRWYHVKYGNESRLGGHL